MEYMLMIYAQEDAWNKMSEAEQAQGMAAYRAYTEALTKAGVLRAGNRLRPVADSTTIKASGNGKPQVLDGPYADLKEQFGGFYLIDVPDLDAAIQWASRCPAAQYGAVELRPIWK